MNSIITMLFAEASYFASLISIRSYSATEATSGINNILTNCGMAVGAIIATVGLIKLMLSLADENSVGKQQASLLVGVGVLFLSLSAVVSELDISSAAGASGGQNILAGRIILILGKMLSWSGAVLCAVAVLMLIMSIANEQAEQKAGATKLLGCGIGLLSLNAAARVLAAYIQSSSATANIVVELIVSFLARVSTYIGGALLLMAIWHFILSIREESSKDREVAIRFGMVSIALLSATPILKATGLLTGSLIW